MNVVGILLAAGRGRRFDPSGVSNKLLAPLAGDEPVALASARAMLAVLPTVIAVVPAADGAVAAALRAAGCDVTECLEADSGMGASLVHALRHSLRRSLPHSLPHSLPAADGWIVALADMPYVASATIAALRTAIEGGAAIAAPVHGTRRGNPIGFGGAHLEQLLALQGDQGARAIVKAHPVTEVEVDDPGIFRDIDTPSDLVKPPASQVQASARPPGDGK